VSKSELPTDPSPKAVGTGGNEANSRARRETDPTPSLVEGEGNAQIFLYFMK